MWIILVLLFISGGDVLGFFVVSGWLVVGVGGLVWWVGLVGIVVGCGVWWGGSGCCLVYCGGQDGVVGDVGQWCYGVECSYCYCGDVVDLVYCGRRMLWCLFCFCCVV